MFRCADDRLHDTKAEANACHHHPDDKDFRVVNLRHPRKSTPKRRRGAPGQPAYDHNNHDKSDQDEEDNDLPILPPETPLQQTKSGLALKFASPRSRPGYPTPPFSQGVEDMDEGDNIIVAMASTTPTMTSINPTAQASTPPRRRSPTPAQLTCETQVANSHRSSSRPINGDPNDALRPLSSSPPPLTARSASPTPTAASAAATSPVPETALPAHSNSDNNSATDRSNAVDDAENDILALRATRAHLTDALATSTFRTRNLLTRATLSRIELQRSRIENTNLLAREGEAWKTVKAAREARKNARITVWMLLGLGVGYAVWCWVHGVEMAYVRSRRCWVYGLGEGC